MPDPAADADLIQRYQTIEQAYCESRWREVLREGEKLLDAVARAEGGETEGLAERLQLLLGHTHLYGFGDRDAAEDHYSAVLRSRADASLRQIASEGLARCNQPRGSGADPAAEALSEPEPTTPEASTSVEAQEQELSMPELAMPDRAVSEPAAPEPVEAPLIVAPELTLAKEETTSLFGATLGAAPAAIATPTATPTAAATPWQTDSSAAAATPGVEPQSEAPSAEAATPWLQAAGGGALATAAVTAAAAAELPRLVPEVLEEPEQIEVHQSTPELADERILEPVIEPLSEPATAAFPYEELDEEIALPEDPDPEAAEEPLPALELALPEPAADEDPELVRGLLRVLIR